MADTLIFLDLPPALGDATLVGYEGQIELETVNWGLSISHSMTDKAEVKMVPQRLTLTKFMDKSSINLATMMNARKKFTLAGINFATMGPITNQSRAIPVMRLELDNGYVESIKIDASESGQSIQVKETVMLSFNRCTLKYYPVDVRREGRGGVQTFICAQPWSDA